MKTDTIRLLEYLYNEPYCHRFHTVLQLFIQGKFDDALPIVLECRQEIMDKKKVSLSFYWRDFMFNVTNNYTTIINRLNPIISESVDRDEQEKAS